VRHLVTSFVDRVHGGSASSRHAAILDYDSRYYIYDLVDFTT
jgi:hypothetical protein